ncbi:MAG TPA: hypothetical protein PLX18_11335, partial [Anaerohalosphaeraceae bacterium]|nr:hypothetical protein [Anaerohalosphaeraceae bacterium]
WWRAPASPSAMTAGRKYIVKRKDKWQKARRGGIGRDPAGKSGLAWAKMQILADPGGPNLRRG